MRDHRIHGHHIGPYAVGTLHEVQLRDGSLHRLWTVARYGVTDPHLRALQLDDGGIYLIDVRRLVRQLGPDLADAHERDKPGLVTFHFRAAFHTAAAFHGAVFALYDKHAFEEAA